MLLHRHSTLPDFISRSTQNNNSSNIVTFQAKNIVNYLRIIHRILAPGGVWINLGPLLWHFENNNTNDPSVELDLDEVKALARKIGFELSVSVSATPPPCTWTSYGFPQNETTIDTTYASNSQGMLGYVYHAAFWTATKLP